MTCVLSNVGSFQDVSSVRKFIFPSSHEPGEVEPENEGWEETTWADWEDENEEDADTQSEEPTDSPPVLAESWFQECIISLSPANDVLVVAFEERAVFLQQKWDPEAKDGTDCKYQIIFKGSLNQEDSECITSVMCIPLASQKRSSHGAPDWTCVVVGFTTGYIRIYTEGGSLLLSQLLHEDPVLKLKCRTLDMPRFPGLAEQQEELTILYPSALVTIDGFSLFQSLRACRNQLARAAAGGVDAIKPPPLVYKKWGLQNQDAIVDHVSTGLVTPCSFDQLHTASVLGGFKASVKSSPPVSTRYITAGAGPFVGFYYALDGTSQPLLSEVAMAVASKLKSALFSAASGWLGLGGKQKQPEEQSNQKARPKVEPATSLPIRFGLPDLRRHGDSISLAPGLNLAVTTDSFGRIVLLDVNKCIAVRMWKGYRDAQCGWIQVREEQHPDKSSGSKTDGMKQSLRRVALFLVIYAPRRGILEVWNTQQGPRVAAFNVPKSCKLLSPGYGVMGLNNLAIQDSRYRPSVLQCCLLETSGLVRSIQVPFHLALSDKNSRRAHDLHLMKKLSSLIHHRKSLNEPFSISVMPLLKEFKMPVYKQQALDKVLSARDTPPSELLQIIERLKECMQSQSQDLDYENKCLLQYCHVQGELLTAFVEIQEQLKNAKKENQAEETTDEDLAGLLNFDTAKFLNLLVLVRNYSTVFKQTKVQFDLDIGLDTSHFLSCFKVAVTRTARRNLSETLRETVARELTEPSAKDKDEETEVDVKKEKDADNLDEETAASPPVREEGMKQEESQVDEVDQDKEDVASIETRVSLREDIAEEKIFALGTFLFRSCLLGQVSAESVLSSVQSLHISPTQLVKLLLQVWLQLEQELCRKISLATRQLHEILILILKQFEVTQRIGRKESTHLLNDIHNLLYETQHVGCGLISTVVVRSVHDKLPKPEKKIHQENVDEIVELGSPTTLELAPDWTRASSDVTFWERMSQQFEDIVCLSRLLHTSISKEAVTEICSHYPRHQDPEVGSVPPPNIEFIPSICLKKVLEGGRGIFSEMVAKWVSSHTIPPGFLTSSCEGHHLVTPAKKQKTDAESDKETEDEISNVRENFHSLCQRLPYSLEHDVLQAHSAWEYVVHWNKNAEVTYYLQHAVEHLRVIQNPLVQHGACSMLWHTFLVKRVSAAAFLMDKVGKAPKDRLCRRDAGMSDISLGRFLGVCCDVLEILYAVDAESSLTPIMEIEDLWQNIQGPSSLVELAVNQPETNPLLVDLHKQLCTVMWAIMAFQLKSVKVLGLFDFRSKAMFFKELSYAFKPSQAEPDLGLINLRREVLRKILTCAVEMLPPNYPPAGSDRPVDEDFSSPTPQPKPDRKHPSQTWPNRVYQLAESFSVETDTLKMHHVCELYRSGYDYLTQELLVTISSQTEMATQLMQILGQRLAQMVIVPGDAISVERQSRLPASLVAWLKTLSKMSLRCPNPPIQDTAHLAGQAVGLLPESHSQYPLALQLIEAVGNLT
ncbi:Rab3 GTPase-activating protein non-catalytic subunit [Holothuria leucospilota]|uniref:Rab3 GTPase-activating protein non-catalytic subunit n=1 Tax=Holothuria leucospilota TaxID=206669 RepID=A0A9Q1CJV3_HOLLE|nr:Rab3 GTPase-activating protein non-catalytic subunit [Holothuria leucospilota]